MTPVFTSRKVTLIGHPFVPIGMGEHLRSVFRSLLAVGTDVWVRDVYGGSRAEPTILSELSPRLTRRYSSDINLFCLNGDEVEPILKHIGEPLEGWNVIYPAWELSQFPKEWAAQLSMFDEIWTTSNFTYNAIRKAVATPVYHFPLAGEITLGTFVGRRYFGIPESSFVFVFMFDFSSYIQRKNPFAVLQAFEQLCQRRPNDDVQLVLKVKGGESRPDDYAMFRDQVAKYRDRVVVIDGLLSEDEVKNLIRCCDAFISLHRSEGFGLGLAAAMFLGKPVVATAYSGNMEFMREDCACLVGYSLVEVSQGAYPFGEGQKWAEPNMDEAVDYMIRLSSDREYARRIGDAASRYIRTNFSYRATGLRYMDRINAIAAADKDRHRRSDV
jgi:glycosyltransferase involved in cell wall biosynthesis